VTPDFKVFIGYDSREAIAWHVCAHSIMRRASRPVSITPIMLRQLDGLYNRQDPSASTEFSLSRFLTPHLAGGGISMFVDCDFVFLRDVWELYEMAVAAPMDDVLCVQHDYVPRGHTKMDGAVQHAYPRKNWSSLMLFNGHRQAVRNLTPERVNAMLPAALHRMEWAHNVGEIPKVWNWLAGEYTSSVSAAELSAIHYTLGGPWFPGREGCEYADVWVRELDDMLGNPQPVAMAA
jgi:hypothetical protein